jgi:hypothetical protein
MINCEEASLLSARDMLDGVSMREKISLQMHIAGCRHCRKYYRQSIVIQNTLKKMKDQDYLVTYARHRLSAGDKSSLQRIIKNKIQSS